MNQGNTSTKETESKIEKKIRIANKTWIHFNGMRSCMLKDTERSDLWAFTEVTQHLNDSRTLKSRMMHGSLLFHLTSARFNEFYNWTHVLTHFVPTCFISIFHKLSEISWREIGVALSLAHWQVEPIHCCTLIYCGQFQLISNVRYRICWACRFHDKALNSSQEAPTETLHSKIKKKLYAKRKMKRNKTQSNWCWVSLTLN